MANIKDFIKKIGNSAVSLEEQQQALAQVEQTIIEAKQKRTEAVGKNADMVIQALKTIEAKLEAKLAELNNTPAKQGVQGPAGQDGKNGKDGKAGRDGISGKDGTDGKDGVDGKDGISVVDAKIDFDGSLVVYLSNGSEIDCGQILQPEVAKNIIISSGGSGTSQVVTDTLVSLQNQINTLTGIDGVLGDMAQQNANAVAITGGSITGITDLAIADGGTGSSTASGARTNLELGTMSTQNATAVAITGGTINGTTIGATTPSTVNATTITGQTGQLNGTGQNLFTFSEQLNNAAWTQSGVTVTADATTAPNGATTADKIIPTNVAGTFKELQQNFTTFNALTYTFSVYAKQAGYQFIQLIGTSAGFGTFSVNYDLNSGTETAFSAGTSSIVNRGIISVGDGWYRVFVTITAISASATSRIGIDIIPASNSVRGVSWTGNGTDGIFMWGMQTEIASSVGTYIPTTTTAVYGTPTLSFSGVSTIGLLSTGALFLQPAGTGALQAQATTSTTAGGNARGANAVDWQTARASAGQVASGQYGIVGGGVNNTASAFASTVAGGRSNTASATDCFVGGGSSNTAGGGGATVTTVVAGKSNTAAGFYNFIGGGQLNSGTSGSAVTTQSGTMNATTAVTLSGSNASIKVGQYITGTSIATDTYVAAISGTSLTLSQAASGSSTSTLSFFTPHGVVVGGGNNQATGSYSFIGGGGDAGTAANRNVASGDWSFVGGGWRATASGVGSVVCGGGNNGAGGVGANTASGIGSFIGAGFSNTASGNFAGIPIGYASVATGAFSSVGSGTYGTTRSITGLQAFPASQNPIASVAGVSQSCLLVLARQTTDATPTVLCSNSSAASTTNQVILPNNSAYFFRGEVVSGKTAAGDTKGWTIEGVIKRGANAASTALVGVPTVTSTYADAGASAWDIAVTADTTNGGIRVTFTGQAATTIRTVCQIRTTEMTF